MQSQVGFPTDYPRVSPYLVVRGAAEALSWYADVLNAEVVLSMRSPEGRVRHAELRFGDSIIMLADEIADFPMMLGPHALGGTPAHLHMYVLDVDAVMAQALAQGASEIQAPADSGEDRRGGFIDPFGHVWWIATRLESVSRAELQRRFDAQQTPSA